MVVSSAIAWLQGLLTTTTHAIHLLDSWIGALSSSSSDLGKSSSSGVKSPLSSRHSGIGKRQYEVAPKKSPDPQT